MEYFFYINSLIETIKTNNIMRKIILFVFAFSISSLAFSQTNNNSQKVEKAPRENNSEYCASCPKSENK